MDLYRLSKLHSQESLVKTGIVQRIHSMFAQVSQLEGFLGLGSRAIKVRIP
jgi:hypothetical protein